MPNVLLIRAGATDFDEEHRIQGSLELPLSERGEAQVAELVSQINGEEIDLICAAPTEPAIGTAMRLSKGLGGVRVKELKGLRNLDQGLWEGLPADEVRRKYPKLFRQWRDAPDTVCPPEGESLPDLHERVRKALEKPLKKAHTLAIVVSEPLATILVCILGHRNLELRHCLCGDTDSAQVTRMHIDAGAIEDLWNRPLSDAGGNGQPNGTKGKAR